MLSGCQTCGLLEKRNSVSETGVVLEDQQTRSAWFPFRAKNKRVQFYGGAQMENFAPVVARLAGK